MNEIVKVDYNSDRPTVLGRDLHKALEVRTAYKDWFPRMCEYGFEEGKDFSSFLSKSTGGRPAYDHQLTLNMAKELCMIQRTAKGKECREYFIKIEDAWNSEDMIMARALQFANKKLHIATEENKRLRIENAEMKPKAEYVDRICDDKSLFTATAIAKDFGMSARVLNTLLNNYGVQYKSGNQWVLYSKYQNCGYTHAVTVPKKNGNGFVSEMKWTQRGKYFVNDLLSKNGFVSTKNLIRLEAKVK